MKRIDPNRPLEEWLVLFSLLLIALLILASSLARAKSEPEVTAIENAVLHVVQNGIPEHKVKPWPRHPLARDEEKRREFASAVVFAGQEYPSISPYLLVSISLREGSFLMEGVGTRGEVTAFQIVPETLRFAKKLDDRCTPETYRGSAICAAALLRYGEEIRCDDLRGAFIWYATGRTCHIDSDRLAWLVWDRFGIAQKLASL